MLCLASLAIEFGSEDEKSAVYAVVLVIRDNLLRGQCWQYDLKALIFAIFFVSNFNLFDILKFFWVTLGANYLQKKGAFAVFLAPCDTFESHLSDLKIRHIKQGKSFVIKMEQIIGKKPSNEET